MPSTRKTVRTYTFGCKVNQVDTSVMEADLLHSGDFDVRRDEKTPDVVIVNTCTVTAEADRQARQLIRRLRRDHPDARIVVTGCYAESRPGEFAGVDVLPMKEQRALPGLLGSEFVPEGNAPAVNPSRTRAILKMQDGCGAYCSFCILPYIRGASRSIPIPEIRSAARELAAGGHVEIVVTGTHLGAYGRDLKPRIRLSEALSEIAREIPGTAIRVSSLEPMALTPDFPRLVEATPQIRPHFHIPLQSGSDRILRRMNRKHTAQTYVERVAALFAARPGMAIGADVIVGFPGETEEDFRQTVDLVKDLPLPYLHVFPFSPRPGTKAAGFPDDVPPAAKKERVRVLREIGFRKRLEFVSRWAGTVQPVLAEGERDRDGFWTGHTPHYVPVRFRGDASCGAKEVPVRLGSVVGETPETLRMTGERVS